MKKKPVNKEAILLAKSESSNLQFMRQFYVEYQPRIQQTVSGELVLQKSTALIDSFNLVKLIRRHRGI